MWNSEKRKLEIQSPCAKRSEILQTARKTPKEFISQARSKRLKLPSGGNERYDAIVDGSPKDLNHPKLYILGASPPQGTHSLTLPTIFDLESHNPISGLLGLFTFTLTSVSVIVLGYAEELVHRRHIFLPRSLKLGTPFKVLWRIIKEPDLNRIYPIDDFPGCWIQDEDDINDRVAEVNDLGRPLRLGLVPETGNHETAEPVRNQEVGPDRDPAGFLKELHGVVL
ncbi:hypothetical protein PIB30_046409 [Stylosanthes scabra]|uniref:Uncharacterized protein n=1 Tax=Stylosanthes scabra TaxID=79078 RepID=A0ABU6TG55_9FABA|nr:hypothetical protein [Stylosanthes scabra]